MKISPVRGGYWASVALRRIPGLSPRMGFVHWRRGHIFRYGSSPFVAELLGSHEGEMPTVFLHAVTPELRESEMLSESFVDKLAEVWGPFRLMVRVGFDWSALDPRASRRPSVIVVAKRIDQSRRRKACSSAVTIEHAARDEEIEFVYQSLAVAEARGLADAAGYSISDMNQLEARMAEAARRIRSRFDLTGEDMAFVAKENGECIGHITWRHGVVDQVTGEDFTEIIDSDVVPERAGRGVTEALLLTVEQQLRGRERRRRLVGNVVMDGDGKGARVLPHLIQQGWQTVYAIQTSEVRPTQWGRYM